LSQYRQMIRGKLIIETLASGAERVISPDFPPLPEADQRAVAHRVRQCLLSS